MCPTGMECFMGRCVPCRSTALNPMPMGAYMNPVRPLPIGINGPGPIGPPRVPIGPLPGPMGSAGLNRPPLGPPMGPPMGPPPVCSPGFRLINNQCIRSGAKSSKPLNIITIWILVLFSNFL